MSEVKSSQMISRLGKPYLDAYVAGLRTSVETWPQLHGTEPPTWILEALTEALSIQAARGEQLQLEI